MITQDQSINQISLLFTQSILHGNMRYSKIKLKTYWGKMCSNVTYKQNKAILTEHNLSQEGEHAIHDYESILDRQISGYPCNPPVWTVNFCDVIMG